MILRVRSYSGRKADERHVRFQLGDHEYVVEEVVDQWYGPDAFFKVRADDGNLYILSTRAWETNGAWSPSDGSCSQRTRIAKAVMYRARRECQASGSISFGQPVVV